MSDTFLVRGPATPMNIVWKDVIAACRRIPPLWDLRNYVAVNPFLGFTSQPLPEAARAVDDGLDARVVPGIEFYRERWKAGAFGAEELRSAARNAGIDEEFLREILEGKAEMPERAKSSVTTFAEEYDREHGTAWNDIVLRSAARWLSVHAVGGGKYWPTADGEPGLFASWREAAIADRTLEIAGLRRFRAWAARIPATPDGAISEMLDRLEVSPSDREAYLYRLLGGVYGWASFFRRENWQGGEDDPGQVAELLAIRVCMDAAVAELAPERPARVAGRLPEVVQDEAVGLVFQEALEDGFVRRLGGKLRAASSTPPLSRPKVQAVFCIDVRSEPLRRNLEADSPDVETRGFAGFFGVALNWDAGHGEGGSARCPVLLRPSVTLGPEAKRPEKTIVPSIFKMQGAPAASFSFVEVLGLTYGLRLAGDAMVARAPAGPPEATERFELCGGREGRGIPDASRVDMAAGILKNMGFRDSFARLVLLCGHEGQSANNPHAAGLDCGACGGHGGGINARVAAALLNEPAVRSGLASRGWAIPEDTHFLPGVHDTTTDEVRLLDLDRVPAGHEADLRDLRDRLARACAAVRRERAPGLGLEPKSDGLLARMIRRRSRDWSEVRPEWALARNAAFLAARRSRSRGANLEGRVFLHEYDAELDPDDSVLTLILTAPVVVASWINLQYFASTVDNRVFGAGDKTIHNRVGDLGVVLGNSGDLRTGLAVQSVHSADGSWYHEPLRLQVIVEAPTEKIDRVLAAQPGVASLVENGWIRLFALDPRESRLQRRVPDRGWTEVGSHHDDPALI